MSSNLEITSTEMIKPSSPTPNHLRNLKLSFLDQMAPPNYIPLMFFYKHYNVPDVQASLKKSLSDVLTQFYPLAGRFCRQKSIVDCNDSGALFVECRVQGRNMSEVIKDPIMEELRKYLPKVESSSNIVLATQINLFDCGGIAVAVQMSHNLGDANSVVSFMNAWAAASKGGGHDQQASLPTFVMATLFPPKEDLFSSFGSDSSESTPALPPMTEKTVTKRLVFDKKELGNLKLQASKVVKDPSRVEAVTSFLTKRFRGSRKHVAVIHAVNLRPRMDPPLPSRAFGNAISAAVAFLPGDDDDDGGDDVDVLRNAIRKVDVKEIHAGGEFFDSLYKFKEMCSKEEPWIFTSWTSFPVYEVDYGWGKPVWVSTVSSPYKNIAVLMGTSCGEGVEAWVNILEEDFNALKPINLSTINLTI